MQTNSPGDANLLGDRVVLRLVNQDDFELLFRWLNEPRYIARVPKAN